MCVCSLQSNLRAAFIFECSVHFFLQNVGIKGMATVSPKPNMKQTWFGRDSSVARCKLCKSRRTLHVSAWYTTKVGIFAATPPPPPPSPTGGRPSLPCLLPRLGELGRSCGSSGKRCRSSSSCCCWVPDGGGGGGGGPSGGYRLWRWWWLWWWGQRWCSSLFSCYSGF